MRVAHWRNTMRFTRIRGRRAEKGLKVTNHTVHAMENRVTGTLQSKRHRVRWA